MGEPDDRDASGSPPPIEDFLGDPTRDVARWEQLWQRDLEFPIESHRGPVGRLIVAAKRLLRPLVKAPQNDLWQRQRVFNLILLELRHEQRIAHLEAAVEQGLDEVMEHNDALFTRVDQKLDRYRAEARDLYGRLGAALERAVPPPSSETPTGKESSMGESGTLRRSVEELGYLRFERRFRGSEADIERRLQVYLPYLEDRGPVLDLGCGRGEALDVFGAAGLEVGGVDANAEMAARCRKRGHRVEVGDLFEHLAERAPESLGSITAFHVVEHLPPEQVARLFRLAYGALRPGGRLVVETPNPLSVVVAARNFWLDPTHRRPVHPEYLEHVAAEVGFDPVERLDLHPFPSEARLPEIEPSAVDGDLAALVYEVNRLRDALDELLYGAQDYALVVTKPGSAD